MTGPREIARAELVRDHRGFEDAEIEQIARQREIAGLFHQRIAERADHLAIARFAALDILGDRAAGAGEAIAVEPARLEQLDRKSTRLNSSHYCASRMPSSA